jgi:hypothetical protein
MLQTGALRIACDRPVRTARAYFVCITPRAAGLPAARAFLDWAAQ